MSQRPQGPPTRAAHEAHIRARAKQLTEDIKMFEREAIKDLRESRAAVKKSVKADKGLEMTKKSAKKEAKALPTRDSKSTESGGSMNQKY